MAKVTFSKKVIVFTPKCVRHEPKLLHNKTESKKGILKKYKRRRICKKDVSEKVHQSCTDKST